MTAAKRSLSSRGTAPYNEGQTCGTCGGPTARRRGSRVCLFCGRPADAMVRVRLANGVFVWATVVDVLRGTR
jgi:hypothetical protein